MQFLPATWADVGRDGNGDGVAVPQNLFDAAQATAAYLCRFGPLNTEATATRAILAYNGSDAYVKSVLADAESYGGPVFPPTPTATAPGPVAPVAPPAPAPGPAPTARPASTPAPTSPKTRRHARPDSDHRHHLGHRDRAVRRLGRLSNRRLSPAGLAGS